MIEVKGRTQTERLIYLALKTDSQLRHAELQDVVGGNPEHLSKTLRTMQRDGLVYRIPAPTTPCGTGLCGLDIGATLDRPYALMSDKQRREWFTPRITNWHRGADNWLTGYTVPYTGSSPGAICSAKDLEDHLNHLRRKSWFRGGDELIIRRLYPEFCTEGVTE
jgi:DNA-binding HxlR family transcriptional regulator